MMRGKNASCQLALLLLELDRDELRDTDFFHRYAVKSTRRFHRAFVVCDDYELRVGRHRDNLARETTDVRFVQRRIDLVKQTEGRRTIMKYTKNQRQGGHGFFTAGKQQNVLQTFAGWLGHDVDA